jgi:mRNA interferase RelE/StbE
MSWTVTYTSQAARELDRLPGNMKTRILAKVRLLAEAPYAPNNNVKALKGVEERQYRLRVGDWRVIYELRDGQMLVLVLKIGSRGSVYD